MPIGPGRTATMRYAADHLREVVQGEGISGADVRTRLGRVRR